MVPNDPRSPFVTSGLRVGTPAMTTRGMGTGEAVEGGQRICDVLDHPDDEGVIERVRGAIVALCRRFPVYRR